MNASTRCIITLDRGWVFVGNVTRNEDGYSTATNCANVRKWSSGGWGGMTRDPKAAETVLDACEDMSWQTGSELFLTPVPEDWGK